MREPIDGRVQCGYVLARRSLPAESDFGMLRHLSPWQVPEHPEITLGWQAPPRQHVTTLDPPVDGFTHALSFPAVVSSCLPPPPVDLNPPVVSPNAAQTGNGKTQPNTVTIKLSTPAKQVKLWLLESKP